MTIQYQDAVHVANTEATCYIPHSGQEQYAVRSTAVTVVHTCSVEQQHAIQYTCTAQQQYDVRSGGQVIFKN
jgi:hypothetical protein